MKPRQVLTGLAWAATAAVAVRGLSGARHTMRSLDFVSQPQPAPVADVKPYFLLIVPMLREQKLITDTVAYFAGLARAWGPASVVIVTTEAELVASGAGPSTPDLAAQLAGQDHGGAHVTHHHLADPHGDMADQINYAAQVELARLAADGVPLTSVFVAVYNADSRPDPATLPTVAAAAAQGDVRIAQQSALFTTGLGQHGLVADGIALMQSRWTLAREIPRLRRQASQARRTRGRARVPRFAHCVGHGLFLRADVLQAMSGLPTATMNEDHALGYLASAAGIPIEPLPLLEYADSPPTAWLSIQQTRQWFWAYPDYLTAHRLAAAAQLGTPFTRTAITTQGLGRGVLWLGQSPAVLATVALPVLARRKDASALAAAAALGLYLLPFAAIGRHLRAQGQQVPGPAAAAVGGLAAALISSIGPWWCLGRVVRKALLGTSYQHEKTED
ncbi:glycosyltransferase [Catellatospora sp. NPDC049609]|uniref:glycosyltransferase family 2 protein n=1 Tax=Catellatospora sp. NPDC049609 TaxID=3155505 RepID=UPI003449F4B2